MNKISKWLLSSGLKMLAIIIALDISIAFIASNSDFEWADATYAASRPETAPQPTLSVQEHVIGIMKDEFGLSWPEIAEAISIISCESSWNEWAIGVNKDGSKDLGLWQLNEKWNKDLTRACAFDVYCSTRKAMEIYKKRGNWSAWICSN